MKRRTAKCPENGLSAGGRPGADWRVSSTGSSPRRRRRSKGTGVEGRCVRCLNGRSADPVSDLKTGLSGLLGGRRTTDDPCGPAPRPSATSSARRVERTHPDRPPPRLPELPDMPPIGPDIHGLRSQRHAADDLLHDPPGDAAHQPGGFRGPGRRRTASSFLADSNARRAPSTSTTSVDHAVFLAALAGARHVRAGALVVARTPPRTPARTAALGVPCLHHDATIARSALEVEAPSTRAREFEPSASQVASSRTWYREQSRANLIISDEDERERAH